MTIRIYRGHRLSLPQVAILQAVESGTKLWGKVGSNGYLRLGEPEDNEYILKKTIEILVSKKLIKPVIKGDNIEYELVKQH